MRQACERHLRDVKNPALFWDDARAQHAIRFIEGLTLFEAQKPFDLEPWQVFIVGSLFGWHLSNGMRRFTQAYVEVARGNGKSPLAAAIALYCQIGLGVHGAQVFSAATTRDQARIVFKDASNMVSGHPILHANIDQMVGVMSYKRLGSTFRPLSADASKMDGLRVLCAAVDEVHEHPNDSVLTKLRTGMGKFQGTSSLLFMITTAGYNRESVCWQQHDYVTKIMDGTVSDETYFGYVATIEPGDDWTDEAVWYKANPNLGVSIQVDTLRQECEQAKAMPGQQNPFKRLRLNVWTEQADLWLDMATWDDQPPRRQPAELEGAAAFVGFDLSRTTDLTAVVVAIGGDGVDLFPMFFMPADTLAERVQRDHVPFDVWARDGYIILTPGSVTDYEHIRIYIGDLHQHIGFRCDIAELAFDPYNATQIQVQLQQDGFTVSSVRQGFLSLSAPTKEFQRLLISRQLRHGNNPVLRWMATGVAVLQDPAGNIKPAKDKSNGRIDGIVAAIIALDRLTASENDGRFMYDTEGFRTL